MFNFGGGIPPGMFEGMFAGVGPGGPGFDGPGFDGKGKGKGKGGGKSKPDAEDAEVNNSRLYDLLDVEKTASGSEIKKAYRMMAMKHHPDKGGDPERFKDIQRAFEVLSDPERRRRYDERGEDALEEGSSPRGPQDLFEHMFGGGGRKGGQQRTKDIVRPMWVTLEQLYNGVTRTMPISRRVIDDSQGGDMQPCELCNGKGIVIQVVRMGPMVQQMQQQCPACGGAGSSAKMQNVPEVLEVYVEKGAPDGHKIAVHGKADEAVGCEPGDLVVVVKQQEHPRFMRRGADLYMEHELSLAEALTGYRITIPHLDGRKLVVCNNPGEVLQPQPGGTTLKAVAGQGMPIHKDPFKFGNLFLVISIRFPLSLAPPLAAELRRLLGEPPLPADAEENKEPVDDEFETCFVQDIDPLESSRRPKVGGEAYDEDEDGPLGMPQGVACKQQ
mmetsp:Transcript_116271/g.328923  ORF Transcript_116271/g.328923 Transcript_116271/m.328923 type:complete len:442 (-) Transcript_116271:89-1414(-)